MRLTKALFICVLTAGLSGQALAEDGHDRSLKFNQDFRKDQQRLWGDKGGKAQKPALPPARQKERPKSQS